MEEVVWSDRSTLCFAVRTRPPVLLGGLPYHRGWVGPPSPMVVAAFHCFQFLAMIRPGRSWARTRTYAGMTRTTVVRIPCSAEAEAEEAEASEAEGVEEWEVLAFSRESQDRTTSNLPAGTRGAKRGCDSTLHHSFLLALAMWDIGYCMYLGNLNL